MEKLQKIWCLYYVVKGGQTAAEIAEYFQIPVTLLVKENGLKTEPSEGQIVKIPQMRGHLYEVRAEDDKKLLCGSIENYQKRNGAQILHAGMKVFL